jgi:hypothetical protein
MCVDSREGGEEIMRKEGKVGFILAVWERSDQWKTELRFWCIVETFGIDRMEMGGGNRKGRKIRGEMEM